MNKILIIYYTKTGFTERYAQWVREETNCELLPYSRRDTADFTAYDTIVYGGGVHAGAINGIKWFRKKNDGAVRKKACGICHRGYAAGIAGAGKGTETEFFRGRMAEAESVLSSFRPEL